ncbi:uncharacterized protein Z518_05403 [Rhinocladiella mackenziei CBS 650.93]|uniref:DUF6590 domain-containing protein n=1 Tax=Rhinocladiella mackenziei CBS 650.93 TaxID=1442369 RepID=A0A0D2H2B7_9EURO|nr:uncharacterized protein Z518_05403 [Rhinocladiella mackenziei CBS 650.93]KIX04533.1 hypothetical protein Z518_05403 [Rhinocladiella mackenziei CBS 650.93]
MCLDLTTVLRDDARPRDDFPSPPENRGFELVQSHQGPRTTRHASGANVGEVGGHVPFRLRPLSEAPQDRPTISQALSDRNTPRIVLDFIDIPIGEFTQCNQFINRNQRILSANDQDFRDVAVLAMENENGDLLQRCLQRWAIVKECRDLTVEAREDFLETLKRKATRSLQALYRACDRLLEDVRRHVQEKSRPPPTFGSPISRNSVGGSSISAGPISGSQNFRPDNIYASPVASRYLNYTGYHHQPLGTTASYGLMSSSPPAGSQAIGVSYSMSATKDSSLPSTFLGSSFSTKPGLGKDDEDAQIRDSDFPSKSPRGGDGRGQPMSRLSGSSYYDHEYKHKLPTAGGIDNVDFRGEEQLSLGISERLDPRYVLRHDAATFFCKGRVFSMMFHEPYGLKRGKSNSSSRDPNVSMGPKGVQIYSHIRRMAVIRQRHGYCVCVPISSYSGRGVTKNMDSKDAQAHAIIYPSSRPKPPRPLEDEPDFKKRAIAVNMNEGHSLGTTSRIHFGKSYTIEWNIKVMDVGMIADNSMPEFEEYWKQELLH